MSTLYPINSADNCSVACGLAIDETLSTYSVGGTGVSGSRRLVRLPTKWSLNALHSIRRSVVGSRNQRVCTCMRRSGGTDNVEDDFTAVIAVKLIQCCGIACDS